MQPEGPSTAASGSFGDVLALLSPAKSLDLETRLPSRKHSQPRLLEEAGQLVEIMRTKSPEEIGELMHISPDLAELNAERYEAFATPFDMKNARPAIWTFDGDVYQGMDAFERFDARDLTEAQKTVRILSGLYGVLRPLDLMQPYRLEMGTRLATDRGDSLYAWWGDRLTTMIETDLAESPGPDAIVNLASKEYSSAVDLDGMDARVITPRFEDRAKSGAWKVVSFNAKRARGEMAAWMVQNRVRSVKALQDFDGGGYRYVDGSPADTPVYRRAG